MSLQLNNLKNIYLRFVFLFSANTTRPSMSCLFEPLGILSYLCYLQDNPTNYNYNIRQLLSYPAIQWDGIEISKNDSEKLDWKNHKYHPFVAALVLMTLWRIILIKHRYIKNQSRFQLTITIYFTKILRILW